MVSYGEGVLIDLHTHSTHSDGTSEPAELVTEAAAAGLDVLALTDHDVVSGWAEAGQAAQAHGLALVPGIEVSCRLDGASVHLLAYLPDPAYPPLVQELELARAHRQTRLKEMSGRLAADGFPVSYEEVVARAAPGATLGRPHLADLLVEAGRYPDRTAAFADVLHADSPYYVGHYAPSPQRALELVRAAGGVPVMAHPFAVERGRILGEDAMEGLVQAGLRGVEVHHRDHDGASTARAAEFASRHDLLVTGSSDYHGDGKPNRLGEHTTTRDVLEQILSEGSGSEVLGAWPQ